MTYKLNRTYCIFEILMLILNYVYLLYLPGSHKTLKIFTDVHKVCNI